MFKWGRSNKKQGQFREKIRRKGQRIWQFAVRAAPVFGIICAGLAIPYLGFWGYDYVRSAPYFEVQRIEIVGNEKLSEREVNTTAGLDLIRGKWIFEVDADRLSGVLARHPWIREASVDKELPNELSVRITEVEASALVVRGQFFAVDESGRVLSVVEKPQLFRKYTRLPVITGLRIRDEKVVRKQLFRRALRLDRLYRQMGYEDWEKLSEVHVGKLGQFALVTRESAIEIQLGQKNIEQKLKRLAEVEETIRKKGIAAEYILLDHLKQGSVEEAIIGQRPARRSQRLD